MKVLRKHTSAFSRMVEESTLITLNQNTSKILNSKSGFNRSQIPRLTVSMGENVVVDTIKNNEYSNGQVEDLISENNRRQLKNRGRDDRGDSITSKSPINFQRGENTNSLNKNQQMIVLFQREKSLVC